MSAQYSMPVPKTEKARSLKLRLDEALYKYREQVPLWPDLKMDDPDYEAKIENLLDLAQARKSNKELLFLYRLGKHLSDRLERINFQLKTHIVRSFLFDFFNREEEAILYLEDVTMHSIYYISSQDRNIIILLKPHLRNRESPPYEPSEPDWVTNDLLFSPIDTPQSPKHPLSASEMWRASPDPTTFTNKRSYDATDLADGDEPLFFTRTLDQSILATSSLLSNNASRGADSRDFSDRSGQIKHRRV
jgi:hypothetical protein